MCCRRRRGNGTWLKLTLPLLLLLQRYYFLVFSIYLHTYIHRYTHAADCALLWRACNRMKSNSNLISLSASNVLERCWLAPVRICVYMCMYTNTNAHIRCAVLSYFYFILLLFGLLNIYCCVCHFKRPFAPATLLSRTVARELCKFDCNALICCWKTEVLHMNSNIVEFVITNKVDDSDSEPKYKTKSEYSKAVSCILTTFLP